ncbi:hypothetical protein BD310DRAFT_782743, partial [Dichomitus squalens]
MGASRCCALGCTWTRSVREAEARLVYEQNNRSEGMLARLGDVRGECSDAHRTDDRLQPFV